MQPPQCHEADLGAYSYSFLFLLSSSSSYYYYSHCILLNHPLILSSASNRDLFLLYSPSTWHRLGTAQSPDGSAIAPGGKWTRRPGISQSRRRMAQGESTHNSILFEACIRSAREKRTKKNLKKSTQGDTLLCWICPRYFASLPHYIMTRVVASLASPTQYDGAKRQQRGSEKEKNALLVLCF